MKTASRNSGISESRRGKEATTALSTSRVGRRGRLGPNDIRDNRRRNGREGRINGAAEG